MRFVCTGGLSVKIFHTQVHSLANPKAKSKSTLLEIVNLAKVKNIKVVLVKQPHSFFTRNIVSELIEKYKTDYFLKKLNLDEIKNFWIVLGTIINKNLDYFNKYEHVTIVDPINKLTSSNLNFTDTLHLTTTGNYILGNEIAKSILLKN